MKLSIKVWHNKFRVVSKASTSSAAVEENIINKVNQRWLGCGLAGDISSRDTSNGKCISLLGQNGPQSAPRGVL